MATPTVTTASGSDNVKVITWTLTTADPDGTPIPDGYSMFSDRSVQVYGTFGAGTVNWQGTSASDISNYATLTTVGGAAATFAAAGIKQILESTLYSRPSLTGSTGATLTVIAVCRRPIRN